MNTDPVNAAALASQVMTCPSRNVPTWAEVYRPGDDVPFAVVPVVAFFVVAPRHAVKDGEGAIVTPEAGAELRLRVYVGPGDFNPVPPVVPTVPAKVAGKATESVPNSADGPA